MRTRGYRNALIERRLVQRLREPKFAYLSRINGDLDKSPPVLKLKRFWKASRVNN